MDPDAVDARLERMRRATEGVMPPLGFETRILARLRANVSSRWDVLWRSCRRALLISSFATLGAIGLAIWHDERVATTIAISPDGGIGLALGEP